MNINKSVFVLAILFAASCARQHLNYQSTHINDKKDDDSYPAPAVQSAGGSSTSIGGPVTYAGANNNYNQQQPVDYGSPTYQTFYDELSPYGYWVNYPTYGYVWVPNTGPDFAPYGTNGNWVYTSYGWTWNSGYSWGWAPFHYGRWFYDNSYGWMWVPGNQWAPAWVTWGGYNSYYGWAPCEPGVAITAGYSPPLKYWRFVPAQNINSPNVYSYAINNEGIRSNNIYVISNSSNYNQHAYFSGPPPAEVERSTGAKVQVVNINETDKPVASNAADNNKLNLYKPVINQSSDAKTTPAKVTRLDNLKPVSTTGNSSHDNLNNTEKPVEEHNNVNEHQTEEQPPAQQHNNANHLQPGHSQNNGSQNQHHNNANQQGKPKPKPAAPASQPKPESKHP